MGLYSRLGGGDNKIGVWPFITSFTRVLDGSLEFDAFVVMHELAEDESLEALAYLQAVGDSITANVQRRMSEGLSQATAVEDARAYWFSRVSHTLLNIEFGLISEIEVRITLGLDQQ